MLEIKKSGSTFTVTNDEKVAILFNSESKSLSIDGFDLNHPGEYEKGGVLIEVKEYQNSLFYNFVSERKHITFVVTDTFEIKEEILKFLSKIDILFIKGTKESAKIFDNIESKAVVPYGDAKSSFFLALWQNPESQSSLKVKWDLSGDDILYVNLED